MVGTLSFVGRGVGIVDDRFRVGNIVGDGVGLADGKGDVSGEEGIGDTVVLLDAMEGDSEGPLVTPGISSVRAVLVESFAEGSNDETVMVGAGLGIRVGCRLGLGVGRLDGKCP